MAPEELVVTELEVACPITWADGVPRAGWHRFVADRSGEAGTRAVAQFRETGLTREERRLRARLAAQTRWAKPGARAAHAEKISAVRLADHMRRVDPEGLLPIEERRRLGDSSLRAEMTRLALRSSKARRRRKTGQDRR